MPLLSLINDQITQMKELGITCKFIQDSKDIREVMNQATCDRISIKLIFITPEKISQSTQTQDLLDYLYISK